MPVFSFRNSDSEEEQIFQFDEELVDELTLDENEQLFDEPPVSPRVYWNPLYSAQLERPIVNWREFIGAWSSPL